MQSALVSVRVGDAEFLQWISAGLGHSWPLCRYQMCQINHTLAAPSSTPTHRLLSPPRLVANVVPNVDYRT
ncbi:hypothetical protein Mapa_010325 [Marchantia paleacea]|nr:hypothetical protein Mapa_010325 [Marchantia paleacea]